MPRPKGPKPIRTVPLNQRVAKSGKLTNETNELSLLPLSQKSEATRNSDGVGLRSSKHSGAYPGKENIDHSASPNKSVAERVPTKARDSGHQSNQRASSKPHRVDEGSSAKESRGRKKAVQDSRITDSPDSASSSVTGQRAPKRIALGEGSSRRPSQAYRPQGTPLGHSSVLGHLKFKKRARQPSLLQVAQSQQDTTTDLDEVDFLDLKPDDESTPLVKSSFQAQQIPSQSSAYLQRSRKRKFGDSGVDVLASESQERSQTLQSDQTSSLDDSFDLPPDDEEDEINAPELPRFNVQRTLSPAKISESQAPPRSSSVSVPSHSRSNRRTHVEGHGQSSISSPLLVKHPSTKKKSSGNQPLPPPRPLTTARLQNLLPRRRTRLKKQQSTFDIPSSSDVELDASRLAEDEDELSFHATAKMRKTKAVADAKTKRRATKSKPFVKNPEPKGKRVSTTYTKKTASDSWSGDEEDGTLDTADTSVEVDAETGKVVPVLDTKAKAEMKRLAEKFKEIDDFDMEFEEDTGSSSQMHDAR